MSDHRTKHKTIKQLRDSCNRVLKRGRPKQLKKLRKAYHGKRLKRWWASYASWECTTIVECKKIEGVYKNGNLKGGHTHNHIYNKCHKHIFRSKQARKNVDRKDKKEIVRIFYLNMQLGNCKFADLLKTILHHNKKR